MVFEIAFCFQLVSFQINSLGGSELHETGAAFQKESKGKRSWG